MLELRIGGAVVPHALFDVLDRRLRPAMGVDCDAFGDRRHPGPELFAVPETVVCMQGAEKRLLERVLCTVAAETADEQPVDACAVLRVEVLERRDLHGFHHLLKRLSVSNCETRAVELCVVGHVEWVDFVVVDQLPRRGAIVQATDMWQEAAGGGADAAVQLAKLAGGATFYTALGDDERGHRAKDELETRGVRVEVVWRRAAQRRAVCFLDGDGERTITLLGPKLVPRADDPLPWVDLATTDGVYFTGGDAGAVRLARQAGVLVASARELPILAEAGAALDVLIASANDPGESYRPGDLDPTPRAVVRTEGARGGTVEPGGRFPPGRLPGPVVDAYGAGDAFAAGLTHGLAAGYSLEEALALASRCGASVVAGRGPYSGQVTLPS